MKETSLAATDDGDETSPLNELRELVASWQGHVSAAANDLVAVVVRRRRRQRGGVEVGAEFPLGEKM